jgi:hypothetical protein
MGTSYGGRRARSAQSGQRSRPERARSAKTRVKREITGMEQGAATAASAKFECGACFFARPHYILFEQYGSAQSQEDVQNMIMYLITADLFKNIIHSNLLLRQTRRGYHNQ